MKKTKKSKKTSLSNNQPIFDGTNEQEVIDYILSGGDYDQPVAKEIGDRDCRRDVAFAGAETGWALCRGHSAWSCNSGHLGTDRKRLSGD